MANETTSRVRWYTVLVPSLISAVLAVALWEAIPHFTTPAQAQQLNPKNSPLNAVRDRRDVIVEVQETNKKLDVLTALLKSGKMRVIAEVELKQPAPTPRD